MQTAWGNKKEVRLVGDVYWMLLYVLVIDLAPEQMKPMVYFPQRSLRSCLAIVFWKSLWLVYLPIQYFKGTHTKMKLPCRSKPVSRDGWPFKVRGTCPLGFLSQVDFQKIADIIICSIFNTITPAWLDRSVRHRQVLNSNLRSVADTDAFLQHCAL